MRILAVDDNSHALRYIRAAFSKAGYSPTVTGDPDEALHFMQANRPHLVLLDLLLPDTDGIQLMQKLLDFADIPAIFLSAYGHDEVVARAFDMGAADYIVKPFPLPSSPPGSGRPPQTRVPKLADPSEPYSHGDLTIDYSQRRVALAGRVLTYRHLLYRVWGAATPATCGLSAPPSRTSAASSATTRPTPPSSSPNPASATAWQGISRPHDSPVAAARLPVL